MTASLVCILFSAVRNSLPKDAKIGETFEKIWELKLLNNTWSLKQKQKSDNTIFLFCSSNQILRFSWCHRSRRMSTTLRTFNWTLFNLSKKLKLQSALEYHKLFKDSLLVEEFAVDEHLWPSSDKLI